MSLQGFVLGAPVATRPVAPINTQQWVLPRGSQVAVPEIPNCQQPPTEDKENSLQSNERCNHKRSNLQWRFIICQVYAAIFKAKEDKKTVTLRSYCFEAGLSHEYRRIAEHWRGLKLETFLNQKIRPDDAKLVQLIGDRFPLRQHLEVLQNDAIPKVGGKQRRRTDKEWRLLLTSMYTHLYIARNHGHKETVKSYCNNHLKEPDAYRRIMEVWKELNLENSLNDNLPYSSIALQEKIESKYPKLNSAKEASAEGSKQKASSRVLSAQSHSYFNQHEEDFLVESAACLARMGFPLEKNNLHLLCSNYLKADNPGIVDSVGISLDTVQRIYKDDNMLAKDVENIDPKRASQADPQVLNCFYHQLDAAVAMAHEVRPTTWPARYADMLPTCLYNTDEQGPNPTKLRNPVLIPADMLDSPRLFQLTREGDNKMPFHYSVANIVRADGAQCIPHQLIEGAPAPMVLIADPNSGASELDTMDKQKRDKFLANQTESDDVVTFNPQTFTGWFNDFEVGARATIVNKFGFKLRATPTGSMLKRTFYDFILHFKDQLPHNQGSPEKQGVILFLDWHSSRECPQSLLLAFIKWNILVIVLPSKTSIWSQPCDNGKNETTAMDIAKASHDQGILSSEALDYETANRVFRAGLEANCLSQNDERRKTGTNAVVSSFAKTGLYPMSYENQGWNNAYKQFGLLNQLLKKKRQEEGDKIPTITWIVKPIPSENREPLSKTEIS